MNRELQEWLGLTWADLLVYIAFLLLPIIYFVESASVDALLVAIVIIASIAACFLGMPADKTFSKFTNVSKLVAYPACLVFCVTVCVLLTIWF